VRGFAMHDEKFLKAAKDFYFLAAIAPPILGVCFLIGRLVPLGASSLQFIPSSDIVISSVIVSIFVFVSTSFVTILIVLAYGAIKFDKNAMSTTLPIAITSSFVFHIIIVLIFFIIGIPSNLMKIAMFGVISSLVPVVYLLIFLNRTKISLYLSTILCLIFISTFSGFSFGNIRASFYNSKDIVCTDECWNVHIYAVLSDVIITTDCADNITFISRSEIRSITYTPRPPRMEILKMLWEGQDGCQS
jgi:hypothetical protein